MDAWSCTIIKSRGASSCWLSKNSLAVRAGEECTPPIMRSPLTHTYKFTNIKGRDAALNGSSSLLFNPLCNTPEPNAPAKQQSHTHCSNQIMRRAGIQCNNTRWNSRERVCSLLIYWPPICCSCVFSGYWTWKSQPRWRGSHQAAFRDNCVSSHATIMRARLSNVRLRDNYVSRNFYLWFNSARLWKRRVSVLRLEMLFCVPETD